MEKTSSPYNRYQQAASPRILCKRRVSDEEMEDTGQLPYKSYVRGVEVDFSPENIRRVMTFKDETP
ncbi:hypothetical protein PIB30_109402, partial [Stylosanthes scabra]|nr:hypothetical protein [Stylosanthes scabra]